MIKFRNPFKKIPKESKYPTMQEAIKSTEKDCRTNLMSEEQTNLFISMCEEYPDNTIVVSSQKTNKSNVRVSLTFLIRKKEGKNNYTFYCERQEMRTWNSNNSFIIKVLEDSK